MSGEFFARRDFWELADDALRRMARIIRAAELPHEEPAPAEAAGVLAIFDGIRHGSRSDEERLRRGFALCDAFYAYCKAGDDGLAVGMGAASQRTTIADRQAAGRLIEHTGPWSEARVLRCTDGCEAVLGMSCGELR